MSLKAKFLIDKILLNMKKNGEYSEIEYLKEYTKDIHHFILPDDIKSFSHGLNNFRGIPFKNISVEAIDDRHLSYFYGWEIVSMIINDEGENDYHVYLQFRNINNRLNSISTSLYFKFDHENKKIIYPENIEKKMLPEISFGFGVKTDDVKLGINLAILRSFGVIGNLSLFDTEIRKTNQKIKIGVTNKTTEVRKINDIIIIKNKRIIYEEKNSVGSREFSHRFEVRGHIRTIRGIGRGPHGEIWHGKTWVRDCIKGPQDKELIKKTRIIFNEGSLNLC